jgi:hypothetical protein
MKKQPVHYQFSIEFDGKEYGATWSFHSGFITVDSSHGSASAQTISDGPNTARILLREILEKAKEHGLL